MKGVLKSSIFVVQKAIAPKTGVEFRQRSIGGIRSSLATSYDALRHRESFVSQTHKLRNEATYRGGVHLKMAGYQENFPTMLGL